MIQMTRRKLLVISLALVITASCVFTYNFFQNRARVTEEIEELPALELVTLNNDPFELLEKDSMNKFIIHYHPGCEYCEKFLSSFLPLTNEIKDYHFLLITSSDVISVRQTIQRHGSYKNVYYLRDPEYSMDIFPSIVTPSFYIYNKSGQLTDYQIGYIPAEEVLKKLKN